LGHRLSAASCSPIIEGPKHRALTSKDGRDHNDSHCGSVIIGKNAKAAFLNGLGALKFLLIKRQHYWSIMV
jgi:hypothetical protein